MVVVRRPTSRRLPANCWHCNVVTRTTRYLLRPLSRSKAHGTSTPVGDATELKTLSEFFADQVTSPVPVHSLKGLLGHTGWAAGAASVIAASEYLRHGTLPPQAFFREPSPALNNARGVLTVHSESVPIPTSGASIAIDGFGFGGSNAHLVLQSCPDEPNNASEDSVDELESRRLIRDGDELVVVGWHRLTPSVDGPSCPGATGAQFDRDKTMLPEGMLMLPDLAEDIDITQSLVLNVVGETLSQISALDDDLRRETGIILRAGGKTERAAEATTRILEPRLVRKLAGLAAARKIEDAARRARPSGPYTLQGMMPNVAAGRAALQFNLNGPNFVVDAGDRSLEAAFSSANSLLCSGVNGGTRLVVVAAVRANRWSVQGPSTTGSEGEYAAAFAVTTRDYASELGLDVVCRFHDHFRDRKTTGEQVTALIASVAGPAFGDGQVTVNDDEQDEFPLHTPVWIESDPPPASLASPLRDCSRYLVLARANDPLVAELLATLPNVGAEYLVALVGADAENSAFRHADANVIAINMEDRQSIDFGLAAFEELAPHAIVAVDRFESWDLGDALERISQNQLCELLFLSMQRLVNRIRAGETEAWGLFPGGWKDVIHPGTGAICGMIKSVQRELPTGRLGVLSTRRPTFADAWQSLQRERTTLATEQEVVHDHGIRLVRRLRPTKADRRPDQPPNPPVPLNADSVVIASGGARGVTAVAVEALLREYGCTVVALGRSEPETGPSEFMSAEAEEQYYERYLAEHPGSTPLEMKNSFQSAQARWEAKETLDRLSKGGGKLRYLRVDITNRVDVDEAVGQIVKEMGRVDLVLHGAGVQWSKRLEDRSLSEFRTTYNVKINGLIHLLDACERKLGKIIPAHIFTSAYSIFGNDGQPDYGAANETLDRLCGMTKGLPNHQWSSIAWSAWDGIGMTSGSEYRALAERRDLGADLVWPAGNAS